MGSETTNASRRDRPTPTAVVPVYGSFRLCGLLEYLAKPLMGLRSFIFENWLAELTGRSLRIITRQL